jgi:hypothetical protein
MTKLEELEAAWSAASAALDAVHRVAAYADGGAAYVAARDTADAAWAAYKDELKKQEDDTMKDLNVNFLTDADRPEPGIKSVKLVGLDIHPVTFKPMAAVQSPFFPGDVLVAEFKNNEWICYLD